MFTFAIVLFASSASAMVAPEVVFQHRAGSEDRVAVQTGPKAAEAVLGFEYGGSFLYADVWKQTKHPNNASGSPCLIDEDGWPMEDFDGVVFDARPTDAWNPPEDDPQHHAEWLVGTWQLRYRGVADVSCVANPVCPFNISEPWQDDTFSYRNLTVSAKGYKPEDNLLILNWTNTRRTPASPLGSGITNISLILPNHTFAQANISDPDSQWFSNWAIKMIKNVAKFSHVRLMGALDTNFQPGYYGDPGHHITNWTLRPLPTDASWDYSPRGLEGYHPIPWELVARIANTFKLDVWINLPVSASSPCLPYGGENCWEHDFEGTYEYETAVLLNNLLAPERKVYIEHSNEVWNFGFPQFVWNELNAEDMAGKMPNDPLVKVPCPGRHDPTPSGPCNNSITLSIRRHAQRVYELANIFNKVFAAGRVRPILASWTAQPQYYNESLTWFEAAYGAGKAKEAFWAIAATAYFPFNTTAGPGKYNKSEPLPPNASPAQIAAGFLSGATTVSEQELEVAQIGRAFGLPLAAYESGPGFKVGDKTDEGNVILSQREPAMNNVIKQWYTTFSSTYHVLHAFSIAGYWSHYGAWGFTDLCSLGAEKSPEVPKYVALTEL